MHIIEFKPKHTHSNAVKKHKLCINDVIKQNRMTQLIFLEGGGGWKQCALPFSADTFFSNLL